MGECYWHGSEVYPGHSCPECEREQAQTEINNKWHRIAVEREQKYCPNCKILHKGKHICKNEQYR